MRPTAKGGNPMKKLLYACIMILLMPVFVLIELVKMPE